MVKNADRRNINDAIGKIAGRARQSVAIVLARSVQKTDPDAIARAIEQMDQAMVGARYSAIPPFLRAYQDRSSTFVPLLAATLLSNAENRVIDHPLPDAMADEFMRQASRILDGCDDLASDLWSLDDDVVQKDIGFCRLENFACRAQIVEKYCAFPFRTISLQNLSSLSDIGAHLASQMFRRSPYFEIHTHTPMLDGFNEAGWERCYGLVADLLRLYPDWLGMIGSSWFYDPQVPVISPRLRYLRDVPLRGGAFFIAGQTTAKDIDLATQKSETRKQQFEAGLYKPANYTLIWPRQRMLEWADTRGATRAAA